MKAKFRHGNADQPATRGADRLDVGRARQRLRLAVLAVMLLAVAGIYGLAFDTSIRSDPFARSVSLLHWLPHNQPHPALAEIPVVPVGRNGTLTIRPLRTDWINSPLLPLQSPGVDTARETTAYLALIRPAYAAKEKLPAKLPQGQIERQLPQTRAQEAEQKERVPAKLPQQQTQQQLPQTQEEKAAQQMRTYRGMPREKWLSRPEGQPRAVLHAQCLADGRRCWFAGELGGLVYTEDGGNTWERTDSSAISYPEDVASSITDIRLVNMDADGRHGFLHGFGGLFETRDGGQTWRAMALDGSDGIDVLRKLSLDEGGRPWLNFENGSSLRSEWAPGALLRVDTLDSYWVTPDPEVGSALRTGNLAVGSGDREFAWIGLEGGVLARSSEKGLERIQTGMGAPVRSIWFQRDEQIG